MRQNFVFLYTLYTLNVPFGSKNVVTHKNLLLVQSKQTAKGKEEAPSTGPRISFLINLI